MYPNFKFTATLSLLLLLFAPSAFSQASGNVIYNQTTNARIYQIQDPQTQLGFVSNEIMEFQVNSLMNVIADNYLAIFNITQIGPTASETDELINARYEAFIQGLNAKGLKPKKVFLDMVTLVPVYEVEVEKKLFSKSYNEVPKGFEMQKNIHVLIDNAEMLDKILTVAADNEIYDLVKVDYFVNDSRAVKERVMKESMAYLKEKIKAFKIIGLELDTLYHIAVDQSQVVYPLNRYQSYQAFNSTSFEAMNQKKRSGVTEVRKNTTRYYEKVDYSQYDVVINPVVVEPAVQFLYSARIRYVVKTPPKTLEKHYMVLSPEGKLTTLKIE